MRFSNTFLLLSFLSSCIFCQAKAFDPQNAGFNESLPQWSSVLSKGPTGSAFSYTDKRVSKRQECLNKKRNRTLIGGAVGGFLGNRLSRGNAKGLSTFAGTAAGAAIGSSVTDC